MLARDPANLLVIKSPRSADALIRIFGDIPVVLAAEHGHYVRWLMSDEEHDVAAAARRSAPAEDADAAAAAAAEERFPEPRAGEWVCQVPNLDMSWLEDVEPLLQVRVCRRDAPGLRRAAHRPPILFSALCSALSSVLLFASRAVLHRAHPRLDHRNKRVVRCVALPRLRRGPRRVAGQAASGA